MRALLIILLSIILFAMYLTFDYRLGRKRQLTSQSNYDFPFHYSDMELFVHGPALFNDFFSELKQAESHIHVLFYICKNDSFSEKFLDILMKKAREGVEVKLLLDRIGSRKVNKKMINELRAAGVEFAFSNTPKFPFFFYGTQIRNHRKISVIDGVTGYLGGYNIGKEYIDLDPKLSPWRDYHLKITGEGVADIQTQFLLDWKKTTGDNLLHNSEFFPKLTKGKALHQISATEGKELERIFSSLIQNAKKSITIGSPYFIPSKDIFQDILQALDRGVDITIIVPYTSDHMLVQEASYPFFREILQRDGHIFQYRNGFYHAKFLLIDDELCDLGTANFDNRSFFLNYEINCYIYDKDIINEVKGIINQDLKDSTEISLEDLSSLSIMSKIKEKLAGWIKFFL